MITEIMQNGEKNVNFFFFLVGTLQNYRVTEVQYTVVGKMLDHSEI